MKEQVNDIIIQTKDFMNKKYLDIRKHYMVDEVTKEIKPTTKGIMMNKEVFQKIMKILRDHEKEIEDYFK